MLFTSRVRELKKHIVRSCLFIHSQFQQLFGARWFCCYWNKPSFGRFRKIFSLKVRKTVNWSPNVLHLSSHPFSISTYSYSGSQGAGGPYLNSLQAKSREHSLDRSFLGGGIKFTLNKTYDFFFSEGDSFLRFEWNICGMFLSQYSRQIRTTPFASMC